MARLRATLLGTGTSTGIPVPTCTCEVCTSNDARDDRLRCSCLVEVNGLSILIDAGPDLRTQCLKFEITKIDAVLITHEHFDHVAGIDDLRGFHLNNRVPIPVFASRRTAEILRSRMDYLFVDRSYPGVPALEVVEIEDSFRVRSRFDESKLQEVQSFDVRHGGLMIKGFRIGDFAYLTDASGLPDASIERLSGIDTLILSALRQRPHPTHFNFEEAIAAAHQIGARKTYFIHMTHDILHARDDETLPDGIELAYDGLVVELHD